MQVHGDILYVLGNAVDDGTTAFVGESPCCLRGVIIGLYPDLNVHSIRTGCGCRSRRACAADIVYCREIDARRRDRHS